MRVGGKATAGFQFAAEIFQFLDGKAAFQKSARVDARRGVSLEINGIAFKLVRAAAEKMVEANFKKRGSRTESRNVSADAVFNPVGANDHGQGIPADQALDAAFHFLVAGEGGLLAGRNGIYIGSVGGEGRSTPEAIARS